MQKLHTVLFDLDGTLADTAPDLAFALNVLLEEQNKPPMPYADIRPVVSHGGGAMIMKAFSILREDVSMGVLLPRLIKIYQAHIADQTRLFPGMEEVLDLLEKHNIVTKV